MCIRDSTNPLRILDTKNPAMKAIVEAAPRLMDFLGPESLAHFDGLRAILDASGITYTCLLYTSRCV